MKVVAVIFGGKSVEHDISIITAMQVLSKLPKDYIAFPIYITQEERFVTADKAKYVAKSGTMLGAELYAYCENNAVCRMGGRGRQALAYRRGSGSRKDKRLR